MATVYLALGSNLGERPQNIHEAVALLSPLVVVERLSSLYQTRPQGFRQQPMFLNAALKGETALSPQALLRRAKEIERELGRRPSFLNAPRPIDIDILFYDDRVIETPDLVIPHPRLAERAFVLVPLAELAPHLRHPITGLTVSEMLARLPAGGDGLRLRGHHLLCLLGYRGFGYSPEHVARMWQVKGLLWSHPETEVEVVDTPDGVCHACPHLQDRGCATRPGAEARVKRRDQGAMARLGLKAGQRLTWGEVLGRIRNGVDRAGLTRLCSTCRWFPTGYCLEGLKEVRPEHV